MGRVGIAAVLALLASLALWASPVLQITDSAYTMLLAEELATNQRFELEDHFPPRVSSDGYPEVFPGKSLPRHVRRHGEHLYHFFPHGSAVLSAPAVGALNALGHSTIGPRGRYDWEGAQRIHRLLAAGVCGLACGLFFLLARELVSTPAAVFLALAATFGSQVWSTASRGMTSHTWGLVLWTLAAWIVLRAHLGRGGARPVLLATVLSWCFFVRPTAVLFLVPIAGLHLARFPRARLALLGAGAAWLGLFFAYSWAHWEHLLPPYYRRGQALALETFHLGLASNLVSPSRGLFVYVPATLLVLVLVGRHWRRLRDPALAACALGTSAALTGVVSAYDNWWAGVSYGPRFTTDLVPLWVLLGALGWRAACDARAETGAPAPRGLAGWALALVLWGALVNGAGAISPAGLAWNSRPVPIPHDRMRVFDWGRAQFLCALLPSRLPAAEPLERPLRGRPSGS